MNVQATNASQDLDLPSPPTAPSGPPAARDLAPVTGPDASRGPGAHPPPSDIQHQPRIPQISGQKFLPGNTVFYNAYDGSLLKGTVINLLEGTPGKQNTFSHTDHALLLYQAFRSAIGLCSPQSGPSVLWGMQLQNLCPCTSV